LGPQQCDEFTVCAGSGEFHNALVLGGTETPPTIGAQRNTVQIVLHCIQTHLLPKATRCIKLLGVIAIATLTIMMIKFAYLLAS